MNKVYKPDDAPIDYHYEEYCPHCDSEIPVEIDENDFVHYEFVCPVCGERLMLCGLCHDDGNCCNWKENIGCSKMYQYDGEE